MSGENYIPVHTLCTHYEVEMTFFQNLNEYGLVELVSIEEAPHLHEERIPVVEKIIRLHQELEINFAGIDTVINLLERIDQLEDELRQAKRKLRRYEDRTG